MSLEGTPLVRLLCDTAFPFWIKPPLPCREGRQCGDRGTQEGSWKGIGSMAGQKIRRDWQKPIINSVTRWYPIPSGLPFISLILFVRSCSLSSFQPSKSSPFPAFPPSVVPDENIHAASTEFPTNPP